MKNSFLTNIVVSLLMCCLVMPSYAGQTQLSLEQWKAKQLQHDLRLKQRPDKAVVLQQRVVQVQPIEPLMLGTAATTQSLGDKLQLNINTASQDEIVAKMEGIGRKKAQAILDYRQKNGRFKRVDDLLQVKGIGQKTLDKNRDKIQINP